MSRHYKLVLTSLVAVAVAFCAVSAAHAQGRPGGGGPGGRGGFGGPGGGFGGGFGGGGGMDTFMLQNPQVRTELGIVDEQIEKIEALQTKQREKMREMFSGLQDLPREQRDARMEKLREEMRTSAEEVKKEMESILLPNQVKRLEQMSRQTRMRMGGQGGTNSDMIATELKLDDAQKTKLREKAEEVEKKLREKMAKMRKDAEDELLSVLTPEQRAQWKEMVGEPFEFQFQRGGRGGPGGQGGNNPAPARPADGF